MDFVFLRQIHCYSNFGGKQTGPGPWPSKITAEKTVESNMDFVFLRRITVPPILEASKLILDRDQVSLSLSTRQKPIVSRFKQYICFHAV